MSAVEAMVEKTIEILRTKTWARHPDDAQGEVCLGMALFMATSYLATDDRFGLRGRWDARALLDQAITKELCSRGFCNVSIPWWNDYAARDVDEVIEVVKLAAERLSVPNSCSDDHSHTRRTVIDIETLL